MADNTIPPDWTEFVDRYGDDTVEGLVRFDAWLAKFPTREARVAELNRLEGLWSEHAEVWGGATYPEADDAHLRLAAIWRLRQQFI
jgi:hypothetical protein